MDLLRRQKAGNEDSFI